MTITDEQIRELHQALLDEDIRSILGADVRECRIALGHLPGMTKAREEAARARCAQIVNDRAAKR